MFQKAKFLLELFKFAHRRGGCMCARMSMCARSCVIFMYMYPCACTCRGQRRMSGVFLWDQSFSPRETYDQAEHLYTLNTQDLCECFTGVSAQNSRAPLGTGIKGRQEFKKKL